MNSPWIKALLVVSLGINCMIAGGVAYRYVWGRPYRSFPGRDAFLSVVPEQNLQVHQALRETLRSERGRLRDARRDLVDLMRAPDPDRQRITEQLGLIHRIQSDTEQMVVDQMLSDLKALPSGKRAEYLDVMKRGLLCRRDVGMRMGKGGRRGGRFLGR